MDVDIESRLKAARDQAREVLADPPPLWSAQLADLVEAGVDDDTVEVLRRATSGRRCVWRSAMALETALEAATVERGEALGLHVDEVDEVPSTALAWAMLAVDGVGVGGADDIEGIGTDRIPAFGDLGAGRKNAHDGPAWSAAIDEARRVLARIINGGDVTRSPLIAPVEIGCESDRAPLCIVWGDDDSAPLPFDLVPPRWQRSVALQAALSWMGGDTFPRTFDPEWAVSDWALAAMRIESAARQPKGAAS